MRSAADAVAVIPNGSTVAVSGGGYRVAPEGLLEALAERAHDGRGPRGLTVVAVAWIERNHPKGQGDGTGLNLLASSPLLDRIVSGSFSRSRTSEMAHAIARNDVAAFNYPIGTIVQWLRASAAGRSGLLTTVGLETFVDPRREGGRLNARAAAPLNRLVEFEGEPHLYYPAITVDVALVKASAADERGNLYFDREAFDHGVQDVAMAAHHGGGTVIAEVDRLIRAGDLHPRFVRIPGPLVDSITLSQGSWHDAQDPLLTGASRDDLPAPAARYEGRDIVAALAVDSLPEGAMVNLGAGIPMYDVPEASRRAGRDDLYFTVEQGPMGGWPTNGGVSRHPEHIMSQLDVFDFYEGGGPDVSLLSFGQVDREGNVNVSRFGDLMPGCGGFPNITHGVRHLVFCGTLTTGGLDEIGTGGRLRIRTEGRIAKFVDRVEHVTFNGPRALRAGHTITIVTDRGIFSVTSAGFTLTQVAPGIDIERDILAHIPFPVAISPGVTELDRGFFAAAPGHGGDLTRTSR